MLGEGGGTRVDEGHEIRMEQTDVCFHWVRET